MTDRETAKTEMFWALVWWCVALVAALLVFFIVGMVTHGDDPAAGLVFGGVTFVVVGFLMVAFGPGPRGSGEAVLVHGSGEPHAAHHAGLAHHPAPAPAHAPAPVARSVEPAPAPVAPAPVAPTSVASAAVAPAPIAPVAAPVPPVATPPEMPIGESAEPSTPLTTPISERVREAARAAGEAARAMAAGGGGVVGTKPATLPAPRDGGGDNLKRLKGVGPKFEVVLHDLGIWHFDQIAAWGPAEVAWIDANLDGFTGRVERDDWVGQAKILAAGGETEHSQRVDRGEST